MFSYAPTAWVLRKVPCISAHIHHLLFELTGCLFQPFLQHLFLFFSCSIQRTSSDSKIRLISLFVSKTNPCPPFIPQPSINSVFFWVKHLFNLCCNEKLSDRVKDYDRDTS